MRDADLEDTRIHYPPDPGICPWCGKDFDSDADGKPACCEDARAYFEVYG